MAKTKLSKRYRKYINRLKSRVDAHFGVACRDCQENCHLQLAHLAPTDLSGRGRGQRARWLDALRNPDSYARLCVTCHYKLDNPDADDYTIE